MMEMVWKTVPRSRSSMREAALSEHGSAPRLGGSGGSETRSTAGTRDCLNAIRQIAHYMLLPFRLFVYLSVRRVYHRKTVVEKQLCNA